MVIIEAMACGVPIVASAVGGILKLITDRESGFLVKVDDVGEFASKISKLFEDPRLWMQFSNEGREVVSPPRWSARVQLTVEFLTRFGVSVRFHK